MWTKFSGYFVCTKTTVSLLFWPLLHSGACCVRMRYSLKLKRKIWLTTTSDEWDCFELYVGMKWYTELIPKHRTADLMWYFWRKFNLIHAIRAHCTLHAPLIQPQSSRSLANSTTDAKWTQTEMELTAGMKDNVRIYTRHLCRTLAVVLLQK